MMDVTPYEGAIPTLTRRVVCTGDDEHSIKKRLIEVHRWCTEQFGIIGDGWGVYSGTNGVWLMFRNDADAMHFILRWRGEGR